MPTYDYHCDACGHNFERFQSITAAPIKQCPQCKKNKARRLIGTGAGLIFKGSGFYITDYRSEGYKEKAKAESGGGGGTSESKPSDGNSNVKSSEVKPAAKPESPAPATKSESKPASPKTDAKPAKKKD